jgi:cobalt/nickel transport system permease protein
MLVSLISTSPVVPLTITLVMSFLIIFQAKIPWKFYLKFLFIPFIFAFITFIFMAISLEWEHTSWNWEFSTWQ